MRQAGRLLLFHFTENDHTANKLTDLAEDVEGYVRAIIGMQVTCTCSARSLLDLVGYLATELALLVTKGHADFPAEKLDYL